MMLELVSDKTAPIKETANLCGSVLVQPTENWHQLDASKPEYRLYRPSSVLIASICGGPVSAGLLMSANYRRWRQPAAARKALLYGFLGTIVLIYLQPILHLCSLDFGTRGIGFGAVVALQQTAQQLQGKQISDHKALKGELHSHWRALAIGLGCLALEFVGVLIVACFFL